MIYGWENKTFADVLHIRNGKNQREVLDENGKYPIYGSAGTLMGYATDYICEAGTTIIGRKGSINNPIYVDSRFWNVDTAFGLSPKDGLDSRFLYYFCLGYDFSEHNQGTTIPSLVKTDLLKIKIPVPPIEEQRRIVAILDEAFACIDKAKANTEKNIQNARELFDSYLNNIFSNPGPDWETSTLLDCNKFIDYRGKTPVKTESGVPLITAKNVKPGYLTQEPEEFIAKDNYKTWMTRGIPQKGDILFTTEAPLANVAQLDTDKKVAFAQRIIILQPDRTKLHDRFLKYQLLSRPAQEKILKHGSGATVQGIKAKLLKTVQIDFPAKVSEQAKMADRLDIMWDECWNAEDCQWAKIAELDELKRSILQKAFSGRLESPGNVTTETTNG